MPNSGVLAFAKYLERKNVPLWIRHVVVPGITDDEGALSRLGAFIGGLKNLKALDVLPYHTMGEVKYEQMGIPYPLKGLEAATKEQAARAKEIILKSLRHERAKLAAQN